MSPVHPAILLSDKPHHVTTDTNDVYVNKTHRWLDNNSVLDISFDHIPDTPSYMVLTGKISPINEMALIDRSKNGFVGGADCVWLGGPVIPRQVTITGIDNHQICDVLIRTVGAFSITNHGPVIMISNEASFSGDDLSMDLFNCK